MKFSLIAAADEKMGIGKNERLPWRLSTDLRYFHDTTIGEGKNAVIMGRTTWESIPKKHRPLEGRFNIVMSRSQQTALGDGAKAAASLDEALSFAREAKCKKIFVIGGAQIFAEAITSPGCEEIYLTKLEGKFGCDTFFPKIELKQFKKIWRSQIHQENNITFQFVIYKKR